MQYSLQPLTSQNRLQSPSAKGAKNSCSLEGCEKVAGGRSAAETAGDDRGKRLHPEGVLGKLSWAQRFFSLHYHIVFSTKERQPLILNEWRPRLHSYLGGIIRGINGVGEIVGGVNDHVHLLASLRPVHCVADVMRDLKKDSSNWVKENFDRNFAWQEGYAAFTVSPSATDAVRN